MSDESLIHATRCN